ncbi:MAG: beta-galactosidase trimerization domain-containing protein [Opitutales bacterium]|nr:beta-galactosidase trimerization domain-containing protein [Opitutales bacterium]
MIVDFRREDEKRNVITEAVLVRWKACGATAAIFTLHHPQHFTPAHLGSMAPKVERIRRAGLLPGIYTGLLGVETLETIASQGLQPHTQRTRHDHTVRYGDWLPVFCPNSDYVRAYRLPLLRKAIRALGLDVIYFDLPWFLTGACFCPCCRRGFTAHLRDQGIAVSPETVFAEVADKHSAHHAEFLRFKARSIHRCMRQVAGDLTSLRPDLRIYFNMGSALSMIDNVATGAWLTDLSGLDARLLVEFTPFAQDTQTPVEVCGAAVRLAHACTGKRPAAFQCCLSYATGGGKRRFWRPEQVERLYSTVRRAGGIPYLSYQYSNPESKFRVAPAEAYFGAMARANREMPDKRAPLVALLYSPLSHHFSVRKCLTRLHGAHAREPQTQYLWPLWDALLALERMNIPYTPIPIDSTVDWSGYKAVLVPRTVVLADAEIERLRRYARAGGLVIASQEAGTLNGRGEGRTEGVRMENPLANTQEIQYCDGAPDWEGLLRHLETRPCP